MGAAPNFCRVPSDPALQLEPDADMDADMDMGGMGMGTELLRPRPARAPSAPTSKDAPGLMMGAPPVPLGRTLGARASAAARPALRTSLVAAGMDLPSSIDTLRVAPSSCV